MSGVVCLLLLVLKVLPLGVFLASLLSLFDLSTNLTVLSPFLEVFGWLDVFLACCFGLCVSFYKCF